MQQQWWNAEEVDISHFKDQIFENVPQLSIVFTIDSSLLKTRMNELALMTVWDGKWMNDYAHMIIWIGIDRSGESESYRTKVLNWPNWVIGVFGYFYA